jgi:transposase
VLWVDESGFYLLPMVLRTYAPRGQTPVLREFLTRDHLSAISGITPQGDLYMMVQEEAYRGPTIVKFLKHLLRHVGGKLLIIWDGAPIHRAQVVKDFLSGGGAQRIHLEILPGYAPDLNPDEGIWNYLKRVEMKNLSCPDVPTLRRELRRAKERLRHKKEIILACIKQPGFY